MRKQKVSISIVAGIVMLIAAVSLFNSCSSGSGGGGSASSGTVALYATDSMSEYKQVIATINKVTVMHTGSGATCDVLTTPTKINISNLSGVLQLLNVAECPAVPYNRLHIEFARSVDLMDGGGETSACAFTSYKEKSNHVNWLQCKGETCFLDINGAVNVLVAKDHRMALDFDLKDFDIDRFGMNACSVTMKVSPLHGDEFKQLFRHEGITGLVSNLTTSTHTFTLSKHRWSFTVFYSGITSTRQPGLDDLLLRAQQDALRTRVTTSAIDYAERTIGASEILVKAEGLVSHLTASNHTFTLTYKQGKTMTVDYSKAAVKGALADGSWVEAMLYGYDSERAAFLASRVELEYACTVPDDEKKEVGTED